MSSIAVILRAALRQHVLTSGDMLVSADSGLLNELVNELSSLKALGVLGNTGPARVVCLQHKMHVHATQHCTHCM